MPVLRISDALFKRLEAHAQGFDTPANVIERLLNSFEGIEVSKTESIAEPQPLPKPVLHFHPSESDFKKGIVEGSVARVTLFFADGKTEEKFWQPSRFQETSNLRANIWSGFLRDWKAKRINKAEFHIDVDLR